MRNRMIQFITLVALFGLTGCQKSYHQTSTSVSESRERGILIAAYRSVDGFDLGDHELLEVWAETNGKATELIVRLKGSHHNLGSDGARVGVLAETGSLRFATTWSKRDGPPYEVWEVRGELPETLKLRRGEYEVELTRSDG